MLVNVKLWQQAVCRFHSANKPSLSHMKISYNFENCILCKSSPPDNWEHIIPESLGGRLQAKILCVSCNSTLGSELIGNLKQNASIRLTMEELRKELPNLYSQLMDKATFVGKTLDGSLVHVSQAGKNSKVLSSKGANDSIIQDTRDAGKAIEKILTKNKVPSDEIERLKKIFVELGENIPLEVSDSYTFIKRPILKLQPKLDPKNQIDNRLAALIAFEFLSILIGNLILHSAFDQIRNYVRYGTPTDRILIKHVHGKQPDPIHAIVVEPMNDAIKFHVRLFRLITFLVTFQNYSYNGLDSVYMEDLKLQKSLFAKTREEAKQGLWYELQ